MLTAISLTVVFLAYLICLGLPLARWRLGREPTPPPPFLFLAASGLAGLGLNYVLALLSPSLWFSLAAGTLIGVTSLIRGLRRPRFRTSYVVFLLIVLVTTFLWLGRPVSAWDARSVWFFHAKIIYWAKAVTWTEAWGEPELWWMHAEYPKLFATLAAQVATVAGTWNDHLPKIALVLLEVPVGLAFFGLFGRFGLSEIFAGGISFGFLAFATFGYLYSSTSTGYMDGFLAQYTAFGLIFFYRWLERRENLDWMLAVMFVALTAGMKGEGVLTIACTGICSLLLARRSLFSIGRRNFFFAIGCLIACFLVWATLSKIWRLGRFDPSFISGYPSRFASNFAHSGSLQKLYAKLMVEGRGNAQFLFLFASWILVWFREKKVARTLWLFPIWSLTYLGLLALVYLGTPYPFEWHVDTSALRTVLTPGLVCAAGAFCALLRVER